MGEFEGGGREGYVNLKDLGVGEVALVIDPFDMDAYGQLVVMIEQEINEYHSRCKVEILGCQKQIWIWGYTGVERI
jgi:hypothetical protein